jgi:8-oxo-dGTP pyrophosphatase MutT (NUDIX family)
MSIIENYKGRSGVEYIFEYSDAGSFDDLDYNHCRQVYGVCFYNDNLVIGYGGKKQEWGLIGGTIEKGESFEQTLRREIQEESNMEVLKCLPIGYQKMTDTRDGSYVYQLRYVCTARPFRSFIADPAGGITEIKIIEPQSYKQHFNWGEIGDHIINRAIKLLKDLK